MSKSILTQGDKSNKDSPPIKTMNKQIKPLKKVMLNFPFIEYYDQSGTPPPNAEQRAKKYQIQNPKWASLYHEATYDGNYEMFKLLKKQKSLQLTSMVFTKRQVGATVGHFDGEIQDLEKVSRHLQKLHLGAGAVGQRRFRNLKKYILQRKSLTDLLIVPYWFPVEDQDDVADWKDNGCRIDGIPRLIHITHGQLERFGVFGYIREDLINDLNINFMERLNHFTLKAAFRPESCDGEPDEFGDTHLELLKEVLKAENVMSLTLYCQCDVTPKGFWASFKDLISPIKGPLTVNVKIDYRYTGQKTEKWFKKNLKDLPENIKVTYRIINTSYFLSMPKGFEVLGEYDGDEYSDESEEEEGDEDANDNEDENDEDAE